MLSYTRSIGLVAGSALLSMSVLALVAHADATSTPPTESRTTQTSDTQGSTPSTNIAASDSNTDVGSNTGSNSASATATTTLSSDATPVPQNPTQEATSSDPVISTGDAISTADVGNKENTNVISGDSTSTAPTSDTEASTTQSESRGGTSTVENVNVARTTNVVSTDAETGDNTAGGSENATILTGSAFSSANVINVINTNLIGSTGLFKFLNTFLGSGFDFRNLDLSYFTSTSSNSDCSLSSCDSSMLNMFNSNTASVTNDVIVRASSGGNSASSDTAVISTGDAAASANVVNVVNTNLINSHYLLLALNNFGNLAGDITMPNASFFKKLMAAHQSAGSVSVSNDNTSSVTSSSTVSADSGHNTAGYVQTGDSLSGATTYTQTNTNEVGGSKVFMLVNVFGNWTGNIEGLPPGLTWTRTSQGVAIMGDTGELTSTASSTVHATSTNQATVNNNISVYALTGQNYSASGASAVGTGNAYASSNVVNLVNTNVIGENWMLAIMNIFGDWSGNLAFGHPDLWIGGVADSSNPQPGAKVTYTFTVANHGDADATHIILHAVFDPKLLAFSTGSTTTDGVNFDLGDLAPGATKDFSYTATVGTPSVMGLAAPLSATVTEDQHDQNTVDNTENLAITIGTWSGGGTDIGTYAKAPKLTITKTASVSTTTASSSVDFKVVVDNAADAGPAFHAILSDSLFDPSGNDLYDNAWDLDTINPGDEITLTYTEEFASSSVPGKYLDQTIVTGFQNYSDLPYANDIPVTEATTTVEIVASKGSAAAPAETQCNALITTYLFPGSKSVGEVSKLQTFLRDEEHISVQTTGVYDPQTTAAVKEFQLRYAQYILAPWRETKPSGYVYFTTRKEINELACPGEVFPLTSSQEKIIGKSKIPVGTNAHPKPNPLYGMAKPTQQYAVNIGPQPEAASDTHTASETQMFASIASAPIAQKPINWSWKNLLSFILPFFSAEPAQAHASGL